MPLPGFERATSAGLEVGTDDESPPSDPTHASQDAYDPRPLHERLAAAREAKALEERVTRGNPGGIEGTSLTVLDDADVEFLGKIERNGREEEMMRKGEVDREVEVFRKEKEKRTNESALGEGAVNHAGNLILNMDDGNTESPAPVADGKAKKKRSALNVIADANASNESSKRKRKRRKRETSKVTDNTEGKIKNSGSKPVVMKKSDDVVISSLSKPLVAYNESDSESD